jgi:hypothetical protein
VQQVVIRFSETPVHISTTRRFISEDGHNYRYENLKSYTILLLLLLLVLLLIIIILTKQITKLRGLSPRANYTDRATAACWRS